MTQPHLVIVPCGQRKIWNKNPEAGPTIAEHAYTGAPFSVNKGFAQRFGEQWLILSAKYGFIEPDFLIPGPYNVTFKRSSNELVSAAMLKQQVQALGLDSSTSVIGLGGKDYRQAIETAFEGTGIKLHFPFSGLPIGRAMQATKQAIACGRPLGESDATAIKKPRDRATVSAVAISTASDLCRELHKLVNRLPMFGFPFAVDQIPRNGLYVLFEKGEQAHGARRIVRVGTHTGAKQLRSRLMQHFVQENKDRSIFRKNIGRCMLRQENDSFIPNWEIDLTTRTARVKHGDGIDSARLRQIESRVTEYMRSNFSFIVVEILDKERRLEVESKIASTVSLCPDCGPSQMWLGKHSPKARIRESGLWQVNELFKSPLTGEDLDELRRLAKP